MSNGGTNKDVLSVGLILAGGEGRRMGGDKPFREIGGRSLMAMAIETAQRQCDRVMISSNQTSDVFSKFGVPVVADAPQPGQGPLGGILGGLGALPDHVDWLVTFPVDCPVLPAELAAKLISAASDVGTKAAFARHGERDHYLSSAWHRDAIAVIADFLDRDQRRVRGPLMAMNAVAVSFEDADQPDLFANANTPEDLVYLGAILGRV
jgi:molybdopterin-guanine dinucleotide biosynthesis protein A